MEPIQEYHLYKKKKPMNWLHRFAVINGKKTTKKHIHVKLRTTSLFLKKSVKNEQIRAFNKMD